MLPKDRIEALSEEIEEYEYFDDNTEEWCIKDEAPDWVKKKFKELQELINPIPDDDGVVTLY